MAEQTDGSMNPYEALGVRPFINCCSVRTMHGGSLMLPRVRAAVDAASRQFVNLDELMEAAGQRLAELTGAEWGLVTCGSASSDSSVWWVRSSPIAATTVCSAP